ncbi:hypothetical protein [Streptomyces afghaniensis]|uniref:hypothetical protein n=1 Tax=Streptomyces afghaniensis TaxID=66865 RepID=UPI00277D91F0|nr:hypothetical protein [Streptomyces afghaniensis]MDQ1016677.1 hypothetical protein [Streptomyces afghaniensis]
MSDTTTAYGPSYSRQWRGNHHMWQAAARKYDFPVTTYKVGPNGERELIETTNR